MRNEKHQIEWKEGRRRRAWELSQQGWKQKDIVAALGVSKGAVSQWLKRATQEEVEALRQPLAPGRQSKLSAKERAQLPGMLAQGAGAFGLQGQMMQDHAYTAEDVVSFLRLLLRNISGKLQVIWDGAPINRAKVINDFLKRGAAKRLHLERLPGYAPELNPQEGVWNLLKRRELKNLCCRDVPQLAQELRRARERLRHRRAVLRQRFAHAGCPV